MLQEGRRFDDVSWEAGVAELQQAGLLDVDRRLTAAGRDLHADVESATDAAATSPWRHPGSGTDTLATLLAPLAASVVAMTLPVPNAIGLLPGTS